VASLGVPVIDPFVDPPTLSESAAVGDAFGDAGLEE
jgi:hypothetical protein